MRNCTCWIELAIAAGCLLSPPLTAQTKLDIETQTKAASNSAIRLVAYRNGRLAWITIGPGITITEIGNTITITVANPSPPPPAPDVFVLASDQKTFQIKSGATVWLVFSSGVLQAAPGDYTITGATLDFASPVSAGSIVQIHYR